MLKMNKFVYNIKLFAIIYDYLETAHDSSEKSTNPSSKTINVTLNVTDITSKGTVTFIHHTQIA
jgi:hypothetical protein